MGIVTGPDDAIWIAQFLGNKITRFRPPAPPIPSGVATPFSYGRDGPRHVRFSTAKVTADPQRRVVRGRCRGGGCTFNRFTCAKGPSNLRKRLRGPLAAGRGVDIRVTAPGLSDFVRRLTIRSGDDPRVQNLCMAPGAK